MNLRDAARRGARTFVQAWIGTFLSLVVAPNVTGTIPAWDALVKAAIASAFAAVIALLSYVQNALEDNTKLPAVGKPAQPAQNRVI